jgi:hypothetical protein
MEDKHVIALVLGFVLLVAIGGLAIVFSSSSTGMLSMDQYSAGYTQISNPATTQQPAYQQMPGLTITNQPSPHTQLMPIDDVICALAQQRPATFETFVWRQCKYLNPGRQSREGECAYQAKLDAQTKCLAAPVFQNIQQPTTLV